MSGFLTDLNTRFRMDHFVEFSVMRFTHVHVQYELYFCTQDVRQRSVINGQEHLYHHPCVILSPPYTVHAMSCESSESTEFDRYVFYFDRGIFQLYRDLLPPEMGNSTAALMFPLTCEQADYLKRLLVWCDESPSRSTLAEKELMLMLFLHKLFDFCPKEKIMEIGGTSDYLQQVIQYMVEHFHEGIDVSDAAVRFAVSRSKLDRDFKQFAGISAHEFLQNCRLNQAKFLLQSSKPYSVGEIAAACGFETETYFFAFFKRCTGLTPMAFKNEAFKNTKH